MVFAGREEPEVMRENRAGSASRIEDSRIDQGMIQDYLLEKAGRLRLIFFVFIAHRLHPMAYHAAQTFAFSRREMTQLAGNPDLAFQIFKPEG